MVVCFCPLVPCNRIMITEPDFARLLFICAETEKDNYKLPRSKYKQATWQTASRYCCFFYSVCEFRFHALNLFLFKMEITRKDFIMFSQRYDLYLYLFSKADLVLLFSTYEYKFTLCFRAQKDFLWTFFNGMSVLLRAQCTHFT